MPLKNLNFKKIFSSAKICFTKIKFLKKIKNKIFGKKKNISQQNFAKIIAIPKIVKKQT